jgi:glycosyltransferase involved in cell wall biosynthesis
VGVIVADNMDKTIEGGLRSKGVVKTSSADKPLLSVITVVFNGEAHLEQTILSVIGQSYSNIEHIVIDGGSTDGTPRILSRYNDKIDYWISERDKGIYDAMNKGLDAAKGDWILFLGSDDCLYDANVIKHVTAALNSELSVVYGAIIYTNRKIVRSRFNLFTLLHNTVHHQSAFYNSKLFDNWRYDKGLRLIADYELNLKIYLGKKKHKYVDEIISMCSQRGQSRVNRELAFHETNVVRGKYFRGILGSILHFLYFIKFRISSG